MRVMAHRNTFLCEAIAASMILLATARASADAHLPLAQALTVAPEELTTAALEYAIVNRKAPDMAHLEQHRRIFLDENGTMPLRNAVRRLSLKTRVELAPAGRLQERANRTGRTYYYL